MTDREQAELERLYMKAERERLQNMTGPELAQDLSKYRISSLSLGLRAAIAAVIDRLAACACPPGTASNEE